MILKIYEIKIIYLQQMITIVQLHKVIMHPLALTRSDTGHLLNLLFGSNEFGNVQ